MELVATISRLHRIQGSEGILLASEHVKMVLDEIGVESRLDVARGVIGLWNRWGMWEPRGWSLAGGVRVEKRRSDGGWEEVASTSHHPLVAVAHTPPGEVEARVRLVGREPAKQVKEERGLVVLSFSSNDYYDLAGKGVELIVASHRGPGIRYYGVFPPPFQEEPKIIAVSLPLAKALSLDGEIVRVVSNTEYREPVTPVLHARLGDDSGVGVLLMAHICHPTPGAHDNASGVAVLVEVLRLLREHESYLREKGIRVDALIVPEYTGTAYAIDKKIIDIESTIAAMSIDMVGSKLDETGGSLNLYTSLLSLPSPLDPILYRSLWMAHADASAFDYGRYPTIGLYPMSYSMGSDHDVVAAIGIPASLVNEWPDKYYHTSLDTPEKLSPQMLAHTAAAIAASILTLASRGLREVSDLLEKWMQQQLDSMGIDLGLGLVSESRLEAYRRVVEKGVCETRARITRLQGRSSEGGCWEREVKIKVRGPLSSRYLKLLGGEAGAKILEAGDEGQLARGLASIVLSATGNRQAVLLEAYASRGKQLKTELIEALVQVMS